MALYERRRRKSELRQSDEETPLHTSRNKETTHFQGIATLAMDIEIQEGLMVRDVAG